MIKTPENLGYEYGLQNFDNPNVVQQIFFIKKEPVSKGSTEMKVVQDGTTNEELIKVSIDRLGILHAKFPSVETLNAITKLQEALMWLYERTQDRLDRGVEGTHQA